jgi:hypothetical protein
MDEQQFEVNQDAVPEEPTPGNPFTSIFFHPRRTIRCIVNKDVTHHVLLLFILSTMVDLFINVWGKNSATMSIGTALAGSIVAGCIIGYFALKFLGMLYAWTGSWFGGQASRDEIRAALAWTKMPTFVFLGFWILHIAAFRFVRSEDIMMGIDFAFWGIAAVLGIWSLFMVCHAVGEVHQFSAWKGAVSLTIGNVVLMAPFALLLWALVSVFPDLGVQLKAAVRGEAVSVSRPVQAESEELEEAVAEPVVPLRTNVNLAVEGGRVFLTDGSVIQGKIMYEDDQTVYVETPERMLNLDKSQVDRVQRGEV